MQNFVELETMHLPNGVLATLRKLGFTHGLSLPNKRLKIRKWEDVGLRYDYYDLPQQEEKQNGV